MYLSNIKLWNFRKFGSIGDINLREPNLDLKLTKGLNVLIGKNDSGKSAILDAIKHGRRGFLRTTLYVNCITTLGKL